MKEDFTYKKAGVDIAVADAAKQAMTASLIPQDKRVLNRHGAFASLFEADFPGIKSPVLVLKTEEPGSKQLLALQHGHVRSLCYDLINHLVNDIVVMGAQPLAVLDTIICGGMEKEIVVALVDGMAQACRELGCTLVGGETSEQPGVLPRGAYVLSASVLGVVDKNGIIDGSAIREGDTVLCLPANGLHTNGYTLVRRLLETMPGLAAEKAGQKNFLAAVLEPHTAYLPYLKGLFAEFKLHGLAHITGGGMAGNLNRVLPQGLDALIDLSLLRIPDVFAVIRRAGGVPDEDMLRTFNLGAGILLVCAPEDSAAVCRSLIRAGCQAYAIGEIVPGSQAVRFKKQLVWNS